MFLGAFLVGLVLAAAPAASLQPVVTEGSGAARAAVAGAERGGQARLQQATQAPRGCGPQDVVVTPGSCRDFVGWRWTGSACVAVDGCACSGADCDEVAQQTSWMECMLRHRGCCSGATPTASATATETPEDTATPEETETPTPGGAHATMTDGPPPTLGTATEPIAATATETPEDTPTVASPVPSETPTPAATPDPTTVECACWPQDIYGTPGDCEEPQILGYRHVGHGVCRAVLGCEEVGGFDREFIFEQEEDCRNAYSACACLDCEGWPEPRPAAQPTECGEHCVDETGLLDWRRWYPMDRGQKPGERAINWWDDPNNPCWYYGQSTWNYPGVPTTLKCDYEGQLVNYYFNWPCNARDREDPDCNDYRGQMEMISEHRDELGRATRLDHWGWGQERAWRVFYDPLALGTPGTPGCNCTEEVVATLSDPAQTPPEEQAAKRVPLSMMAPCEVGQTAYGPLTCSGVYTYGSVGEQEFRGYDARILGNKPGQAYSTVGLYFARVSLLGYLEDPEGGCNVAHLLNEYFTTECDRIDADCGREEGTGPQCEGEAGPEGSRTAKRFTFRFEERGGKLYGAGRDEPGSGTPTPSAQTCADCEVAFCLDVYEDYYLRQVPADGPLENGEYRNSGGMLGFWIGGLDGCPIDNCPFWYIDAPGGQGGAPTPTGSPAPSPTAAGATMTPLPLEHDEWRTRCPKDLPNCNTTPVATRTPGGMECPTQFVEPAYPGPTDDNPRNACPGSPFPPEATTDASRTAVPYSTDRPGLTPIPTATGSVTCGPTHTSTVTATLSSTATFTPTMTDTPTATHTPIPTCGVRDASRDCGAPQACPSGCHWMPTVAPAPELACDPTGPYQVTVIATECDTSPPYCIEHYPRAAYDRDGDWQEDMAMSYVGLQGTRRQWKAEWQGLDFTPTKFRLLWWTTGGHSCTTGGMASIDVTYCCQ
jgi:hypothetical protein